MAQDAECEAAWEGRGTQENPGRGNTDAAHTESEQYTHVTLCVRGDKPTAGGHCTTRGLHYCLIALPSSFHGGLQITDRILLDSDLGLQGFPCMAVELRGPGPGAPGLPTPGMAAPCEVTAGLIAPSEGFQASPGTGRGVQLLSVAELS